MFRSALLTHNILEVPAEGSPGRAALAAPAAARDALRVRSVRDPNHHGGPAADGLDPDPRRPGAVLRHTLRDSPLAFVRNGDGIVGIGEALRFTFSGPERMREASAVWRALVQDAVVDDPCNCAGPGSSRSGRSRSPTTPPRRASSSCRAW
ncbi:hypothetical protein P9139_18700 [Curtobacterium flaccumfaciens]|nr:hypothetical protein P9139_18700 [Curtobacterium flaccumfaciens]